MTSQRFTVLPYMLAIVMAIAAMPTEIYQVCAWNVGTLKVEPWRRKLSESPTVKRIAAFLTQMRSWFKASGGLTGLPATACLLAIVVLALHVGHQTEGHGDVMLMGLTGLKGLRQRDSDLKGEIAKQRKDKTAVGEKAVAEKRAMSEDERAKFLAFTPVIDGLEAQLTENSEMLAEAERANEAERAYQGVKQTSDTDESARAAAAAKVGDGKTFKSVVKGAISGEFLQAVYRAAVGATVDPRLVRAAATGLNETVPSEGGFLVGTDQASGIVQRTYETGEILKRVFKLPISANSNGIKINMIDETSRANGSRFGGIQSYWLAEAAEKTASKPKFRQANLELKKVAALVYATDELLQDTTALEAWIDKYLPLELSFKVEDAIVSGTGSGQPLGILNSGATITVTRNTAARVLLADVQAMWGRMWAPARKNAVWLVDQSVEAQLETLNIAIGTSGVLAPIYKAAGSTPGQEFATLYGRPILTTEYNAALGTPGDIILANFDEYTLIDKGGIQQATSIHVRFVYDESVFRFVYRVDGQPNWNTTLTPKSGGSTLSPFIILS